MSDTNKKVTLSIYDEYDGNDDGIINIGPNIQIYKVCNDLDDLYSINTKQFEDKYITCYVKNVNANVDEINYRGAFFTYDVTTGGWVETVVANHTHNNKEILDKFASINDDLLDPNKKYTIRLIKTESGYDFEWVEDSSNVPDVPINPSSNMYLTSDGTNIAWTNNIAPAQSFKKLKFLLDETNMLSAHHLVLHQEDVHINLENDELIIFDNGILITDPTISIEENTIDITINSDDFSLGEIVTILVIRNGISGFLDAVADEYVTKKELLAYSLTGDIDLNKYVTKNELDKLASKHHHHSEYSGKDHNHDYRYANYHHTHSHYLTRAQVLAIIADAAGVDGDIEVTGLIQNLVNDLTTRIDQLVNTNYITTSRVENMIAENATKLSNSDNIYYNGESLSSVISDIKTSTKSVDELDASKIKLNFHNVTRNVGGFNQGDVIYGGMELDSFIEKLLSTNTDDIIQPELKCNIIKSNNTTNYEVGEHCNLIITPEYIQNDAGLLMDISLSVETNTGIIEYDLENKTSVTIPLDLLPFDGPTLSAKLTVIARYDSNSNIEAGSIVHVHEIHANRFAFCGSLDTDLVRTQVNQSEPIRTLREFVNSDELSIKLNNLVPHKIIIFAIPTGWNKIPSSIIYHEQGCEILDMIETWQTNVLGDNNSISEPYTIYAYRFQVPSRSSMTFTVKLRDIEVI